MIESIFGITAFIVIYIYVGYPLITFFLARLFGTSVDVDPEFRPAVTLIVSVYNEEEVILHKLENIRELDYPKELLKVFVISDASEDRTDELVRGFEGLDLELFRLEERRGKTYGISRVMRKITSDIVVFSDANAIYEKNAIKELAKYFVDENVGYVVGNAQYYTEDKSLSGRQERRYWSYELTLKKYEAMIGSVVGGDGAIYAIRKDLFILLDEEDINDFVNPLHIILMGYRGVFSSSAICYEYAAETFEMEAARKRRIVNRSWRGMLNNIHVLNPFNTGVHAWQLFSHKFLRWLGGLFLMLLFVLNVPLLHEGWFYVATFSVQLLLIACSFAGWLGAAYNMKVPLFTLSCYYFVRVNISSILGIIDNCLGKTYTTWSTIRE